MELLALVHWCNAGLCTTAAMMMMGVTVGLLPITVTVTTRPSLSLPGGPDSGSGRWSDCDCKPECKADNY